MDSSIENAEEMARAREFFKELFGEVTKEEKDARGEFFKQLAKKEHRRQEKMKK